MKKYLSCRMIFFLCGLSFLGVAGLFILLYFCIVTGRLFFVWAALLLSYGVLSYMGYQYIWKPYQGLSKVYRLFAMGYTLQGIFEQPLSLNPAMEAALQRFQEMQNLSGLVSASKKQAQYLALQNQINPHFLYNTLEGIRSDAMLSGLDSVAEMTEALATFFRYTISNVEHLVTLEDELQNIETYYTIQKYRFGERLTMLYQYEEEAALKYRLPKLTLQPIVENSIYHGIERKMGNGTLTIRIETTEKRLIITISDDGLGMEQEALSALTEKLSQTAFDGMKQERDKKGGIAILNVNNRIRLLFGEEYGISIYSTLQLGTDVEITLPLLLEDEGFIDEKRNS